MADIIQNNTVEQGVYDAIHSGKAKMKPRWYFILRTTLMLTGGIIAFIFLLYFVSFIVFALHQSGAWFAPDFGFSGWYPFFRSLPLILIFLSLIFIVALAILARRYAFIYHRPILYLLLVMVMFIGLGSALIATTALHPALEDYARQNNLLFITSFYKFESASPSTIHEGQVIGILPNGFLLEEVSGTTSTVILNGLNPFQIGDRVVVFGPRDEDGSINSFGAEKLRP